MIAVPQTALDALANSFGTTADQLSHFGGGQEESDGVVYTYPYKGAHRLLKIMAIPTEEQQKKLFCLEERLHFVRFLGENGAHIVFPQFSPQGKLYETALSETHVWVGYSMDIAPGKVRKETAWDTDFFRNWGQSIGLLHRLARQYHSWEASIEPESGEELLTWQEEWTGFHSWCPDDEVKSVWVEIKQELDKLPKTRGVFGFIHNDPHIWNLLADGDQITLLDFDVANHHWFINDIAIACQSILTFLSGGMSRPVHNREKLHAFLKFFMEGYEREYHLSPEWMNRLDLFIAYRRILLFIVMNGWIKSQPELHTSWKQMILSHPEVVGDFLRANP
ncbi:MAG: phosphotransferase [Anaerolineae bacterium]|nr:phosphotransferase [Anaerolineae bacterium]